MLRIPHLFAFFMLTYATHSYANRLNPDPCLQMYFGFVYDEVVPEVREKLANEINEGVLPRYGKNFSAEAVPELDTIRVYSKLGRVFEGASERVLWLHGLGGNNSKHTSMLELIAQTSAPVAVDGKKVGKKGSTKRKIRNLENFVQIAGEAIDTPGTVPPFGVGPSMLNHRDLSSVANWLARNIIEAKSVAPHLPLTIGAKSASPLFVLAALPEVRKLVDRIVLISPELPNKDINLRKTQWDGLRQAVEQENAGIEWDVIKWIDSLNIRDPWVVQEFLDKPTLILTGSKDTEVVQAEKDHYAKLAAEAPNIQYVNVAGAGHDVFSTNININPHLTDVRKAGLESYRIFYDFLARTRP